MTACPRPRTISHRCTGTVSTNAIRRLSKRLHQNSPSARPAAIAPGTIRMNALSTTQSWRWKPCPKRQGVVWRRAHRTRRGRPDAWRLRKAGLCIRCGVAAEATLRERNRPHRGNAMRTQGTVRCGGANDDYGNKGADQDESKQPRNRSPSRHRRPLAALRYPRNAGAILSGTRSIAIALLSWARSDHRVAAPSWHIESYPLKVDWDLAEGVPSFHVVSRGRERMAIFRFERVCA